MLEHLQTKITQALDRLQTSKYVVDELDPEVAIKESMSKLWKV